jgi:hypothetical protein
MLTATGESVNVKKYPDKYPQRWQAGSGSLTQGNPADAGIGLVTGEMRPVS